MQVVHIWLSHLKRTGWPLQVLKIGFVFAFFAWFFKPPMAQADLPHGSAGKESACSAGDVGLITGLRRSPGEGNGNLLQYSCLENPMDRGTWQTTVHGVAKSQTRLSDFTSLFSGSGWDRHVSRSSLFVVGRHIPLEGAVKGLTCNSCLAWAPALSCVLGCLTQLPRHGDWQLHLPGCSSFLSSPLVPRNFAPFFSGTFR